MDFQNKPACEAGMIPNCTGIESINSTIKAVAMKKKVGLIEACEMDQNRAVLQILAFLAYLEGLIRGKGPTIFELSFRSADKIGSTKQFEEASNLLFANIEKYDLLRSTPLNGDLSTKSVKRKGLATDACSPIDSHRPDKVLITSPNTRSSCVRRKIVSSREPDTEMSAPDVIDLSDSENVRPDGQADVPERVRPTVPAEDKIEEAYVKAGEWHIKRWSKKGRGPQCNGVNAPGANRPECRCWVKREGIPNSLGIACVYIHWSRIGYGGAISSAHLYYCPNNICFRGKERKGIERLPSRPQFLPVAIGTSLTDAEISHFREIGLINIQRDNTTETNPFDLRIDVNLFTERVDLQDPSRRLPSRNGKLSRQRTGLTSQNLKRIASANQESMSLICEKTVTLGNRWGMQYQIRTHEENEALKSSYWVQICCFPCCSCDDFFKSHSHKRPYLTCKHLYWVYKNVFGLDLLQSSVVNQPVLSIGEIQTLISGRVI